MCNGIFEITVAQVESSKLISKIARYPLYLCELHDITRLRPLSLVKLFIITVTRLGVFRISWVMCSWQMVYKKGHGERVMVNVRHNFSDAFRYSQRFQETFWINISYSELEVSRTVENPLCTSHEPQPTRMGRLPGFFLTVKTKKMSFN